MKKNLLLLLLFLCSCGAFAQDLKPDSIRTEQKDTLPQPLPDTVFVAEPVDVEPEPALRIVNINPYFTLHVDSSLSYQLEINKDPKDYFWYLRNSPVGLRINKDNGLLSFKADKAYFLSGRLKYDVNYKVTVGVQNLKAPNEKVDTTFTLVFYNTEIVPSRVKPTVSGNMWIEEGETINFRVFCETGSFPIEHIMTLTSSPIKEYSMVEKCGDEFRWTPSYDVAKESDTAKARTILLYFVGSTKFGVKDTAMVRLIVRDALNYPLALQEYNQAAANLRRYIMDLKYTFLVLDKRLKKTRRTRTSFDLFSASTSLTGTILSTSGRRADGTESDAARYGKILPSVGLSMVPIKEAAVPAKVVDQNQASQIRGSIKRLEYMMTDHQLLAGKDPDIVKKTNKLRDELKQVQVQLIDIPMELTNDLTEEELNRYFNSPKVNKKYRLRSRK